jgi:hypothetical protein
MRIVRRNACRISASTTVAAMQQKGADARWPGLLAQDW